MLTIAIGNAAANTIPRGCMTNPKACWSDELERKSKECDEARAKCHESTEAAHEYVKVRDEFTKACTDAKIATWHSFVEGIDSRTNPSKIWNVIGGFGGLKSKY